MPDDFDIPEFAQIGTMMQDLLPGEALPRADAATPARRQRLSRPNSGRRRARLARVLVSQFIDSVNWSNAADFASPLQPAPSLCLSRFSVGQFAASVNWRNSPQPLAAALVPGPATSEIGSAATTPQPTVDSLLSEFSWD